MRYLVQLLLLATFAAAQDTGVGIVPPTAAPNFGAYTRNGATFTDTSYRGAPDNYAGPLASVYRCTDANLSSTPNYTTYTAGQGGAGNTRGLWNSNHTALVVNGVNIILFNDATGKCGPTSGAHAGSGFAITTDMNTAGGGSSSSIQGFGNSGAFDFINPSLYYYANTVGLSATTNTQIGSVTINTSSGAFTDNGILAEFAHGLPIGTNVAPWSPNTAYSTGVYVTYALTGAQAPAWASGHAYSLGDLIIPTTGNPNGCMFKVSTPGTSGGTQPTWPTTACSYGVLSLIDNGVKWQGTSATGAFVFQLVSAGGTSGSSTPAFVPVATGHPDMLTQVGDNGLTWVNVGPDVVASGNYISWTDFGWQSNDATRFCEGLSTNNYGWLAGPNGNLNNYNSGSQGTGIYYLCYSTALNAFHLINTATGIQSVTTCSGGAGYACAGGSWSMAVGGASAAVAYGPCGGGYFLHAGKASVNADYVLLPPQTFSNCATGNPGSVIWRPFAPFNAATSMQLLSGNLNHYGMGTTHMINTGQNGGQNGGYAAGSYGQIFDLANPSATPSISWQEPVCDARHYFAGITYTTPPCEFGDAYDQHVSWAANNNDTGLACGTFFNLPTLNPTPFAPWQGEEVCFTTVPNWSYGGSNAGQVQYRYTHTFVTGANANFSTQFGISQESSDGKFLAWSTDDLCGFGNTAGTAAALYPAGATLCGQNWQPSFSYSLGTLINPFGSTTGGGTNYGVWQISTAGTSAATKPAWVVCTSGNAGTVVTDGNGVGYTCIGAGNARGDVLIVALGAAAPAPQPGSRVSIIVP